MTTLLTKPKDSGALSLLNERPESQAMNVDLTPELEQLVIRKVEAGHYQSPSEVIREALRTMDELDQVQTLHVDEIRAQINAGLESLQQGKGLDGELVFQRLETELDEMERKEH
jgi:antitoxin ParD1/3/4